MPLYAVSFQLTSPSKNYDGLARTLKSYGARNPTEGMYLVETERTAKQVHAAFRLYLAPQDELFVCQLAGPGVFSPLMKTGIPTARALERNWIRMRLRE